MNSSHQLSRPHPGYGDGPHWGIKGDSCRQGGMTVVDFESGRLLLIIRCHVVFESGSQSSGFASGITDEANL